MNKKQKIIISLIISIGITSIGCDNKDEELEKLVAKEQEIVLLNKNIKQLKLENYKLNQQFLEQKKKVMLQNMEKQKLEQQVLELNKIVEQYKAEQQKLEKQGKEIQKENEFIKSLYLAEYEKQGGIPKIRLDEIAVGKIGQFSYPANQGLSYSLPITVEQVIDSEQMLVEIRGPDPRGGGRPPRWVELVWIKGISTSGIVDNSAIKLDQIFYIKGTKTYETAFGSTNTVFLAEAVNIL